MNNRVNSLFGVNSAVTLLFIALNVCSFSVFAAESDNPPFFKVQWQNQQSYLLGSIHVGRDDFYPLPTQIEQQFAQANALVIEADINKADVPTLLQKYGLTQQAASSQETKVLAPFCTVNAAVCQNMASFLPWLKSAQIGVVRFQALGYSPEKGVDMYFVNKAGHKTLLELENVAFQFELVASFSKSTQMQMLKDTVTVSDEEMLELITAWRSGDHQLMASIMEQQAGESEELMAKLLWQRNHDMTAKMLDFIQQDQHGKLFFVIGAGHLVGQQSIPDLLRAKGAKVTDCSLEAC